MESYVDPIERALKSVPEYGGFKSYDELEASTEELVREHRDIVRIVDVGFTRCGRSIRAIVISGGSKRALLFGAPHPNEPVGTLMLDYLSQRLAEDEELRKILGFTFIIVKAIDIDGLKLNEGWLKGPFTINNYAKNYYRPAGNVQVEWSFPIRYKKYVFEKPTPETRALMSLIDSYAPDFIYSLHNSGFGGVYYYISREAPLLYPIYQLYPWSLGIPLSLGEPEVPWAVRLSKAIYKMIGLRDYYDFLESQGLDPLSIIKHGGSSYDYAVEKNPCVFELVTEVPYFYDPRVDDIGEEEISRREAILSGLKIREEIYRYISSVWSRVRDELASTDPCSEESKLAESIEYLAETGLKSIEAQRIWALRDPSLERRATVAEVFDNMYVSKFYSALGLGMLYRLVRKIYGIKPLLRPILEDVERRFEEILSQLEENREYRPIEIRNLVKVQLAAGLYTMLYIGKSAS
ncbi:MAG: M14 family zinc carboxypeptidase [Sulfolobales archaeon]